MLKNFRIERIIIVIKARIQAGVPYKKLRSFIYTNSGKQRFNDIQRDTDTCAHLSRRHGTRIMEPSY